MTITAVIRITSDISFHQPALSVHFCWRYACGACPVTGSDSRTLVNKREGGEYGARNKCVIYECRYRLPVITSPSPQPLDRRTTLHHPRPTHAYEAPERRRDLPLPCKRRLAYGLDDRVSIQGTGFSSFLDLQWSSQPPIKLTPWIRQLDPSNKSVVIRCNG